MPLKNSFSHSGSFGKILLLIALMAICMIVSLLILTGILLIFGLSPDFGGTLTATSSQENILIAKLMQITSQMGLFILPALIFGYLTAPSIANGLNIGKFPIPRSLALVVVSTLFAIPFINLLAQWNTQWHLPDSMQSIEDWMRNMQYANDRLMEVILIMDTPSDIAINVLMMAILPAVGEELLFRGVLQKEFEKSFKNPHLAIFITAAIFSAFHLQFLGFLSRLILGMLFGYLFYYSKNIWAAILAHFTNNFLALIFAIIYGSEIATQSFENDMDPMIILPSIVAIGLSGYLIYKNRSELANG